MAVKATHLLDDADLISLPAGQLARMRKLREGLLTSLADAADDLGAGLDGAVRKAIKRIKAGGYKDSVIRREIKALTAAHYGRLGKVLAGQIKHTATMGKRYKEIVAAYARQKIKDRPQPFTDFATERALRQGRAQARLALAPEVLLAQKQGKTPTRFVGDRVLKRHVKPWRNARVLSKKLHGRAVEAADDITTQVIAATREARTLTEASTELIRAVRKHGAGELAAKSPMPKLMKRVQKAGQALNRRGGEEALDEWRKVRREMKRYMRRLDEGGRVKSSMLELLQKTGADSAKGIDRAIEQHAAFRQKYAAERIIKTETMAAYKAEQVLADQRHDFVVGYIWRMNRSARRAFVKLRTGKGGRITSGRRYRRGGRKRRCVCEELDGKRLSKESVAGRNARLMAHPHCMCFLEPVVSKKLLDVAQPGDFD